MKIFKYILALVIIFYQLSSAIMLNEDDVVRITLKNNHMIRVALNKKAQRKNELDELRLQRYPRLNINVGRYISNESDSLGNALDGGLVLNQYVPWGGEFIGLFNREYIYKETNILNGIINSIDLYYSHPLLRGRGKFSDNNSKIIIKNIELNKESILNTDIINSQITTARLKYWEAIKSIKISAMLNESVKYYVKKMHFELIRFKLGEASEIDTLNALYDMLRARTKYKDATDTEELCRKELIGMLNIKSASVTLNKNEIFYYNEIADVDLLLESILSENNKLKMYEEIDEELEYLYKKSNNDGLPELNLVARFTFYENDDLEFSSNIKNESGRIGISAIYGFPFTKNHKKIEIEAGLERNKLEYESYVIKLKNKTKRLCNKWVNSKKRLEEKKVLNEMSKNKLKYVREMFELGNASRLELHKAENDNMIDAIEYIQSEWELKKTEILLDEIHNKVLSKYH